AALCSCPGVVPRSAAPRRVYVVAWAVRASGNGLVEVPTGSLSAFAGHGIHNGAPAGQDVAASLADVRGLETSPGPPVLAAAGALHGGEPAVERGAGAAHNGWSPWWALE